MSRSTMFEAPIESFEPLKWTSVEKEEFGTRVDADDEDSQSDANDLAEDQENDIFDFDDDEEECISIELEFEMRFRTPRKGSNIRPCKKNNVIRPGSSHRYANARKHAQLAKKLAFVREQCEAAKRNSAKRAACCHGVEHRRPPPEHRVAEGYSEFIVSLQYREITPEDYEMLLTLHEDANPNPTLRQSEITKIRCVPIEAANEKCTICLADFQVNDKAKELPCGHHFHGNCIDTWLSKSSTKCPLCAAEIQISH